MEGEETPGVTLISQGAEAKIYRLNDFLGEPAAVKERLVKHYRHPDLDNRLNKERMTFETRNMIRARKAGINVPYVMHADFIARKIYMQFIEGVKLRDFIFENKENPNLSGLLKEIGRILAKLHEQHIIHGDLTTSNFMVIPSAFDSFKLYDALYIIDFGLSFVKESPEEKAVDLYVLERAFLSTHPELEDKFQEVLQEYKHASNKGDSVIKKLNDGKTKKHTTQQMR